MTASPELDASRLAATDVFRSLFRRQAATVAVITAQGTRPVGLAATSLTSVSAEPPLLSFGVGTGSSSWPALSAARHDGVHLLGEHQRGLATTFATSGIDRFSAHPLALGPGERPDPRRRAGVGGV